MLKLKCPERQELHQRKGTVLWTNFCSPGRVRLQLRRKEGFATQVAPSCQAPCRHPSCSQVAGAQHSVSGQTKPHTTASRPAGEKLTHEYDGQECHGGSLHDQSPRHPNTFPAVGSDPGVCPAAASITDSCRTAGMKNYVEKNLLRYTMLKGYWGGLYVCGGTLLFVGYNKKHLKLYVCHFRFYEKLYRLMSTRR